MRMLWRSVAAIVFSSCSALAVSAQEGAWGNGVGERIVDFGSRIEVGADGALAVTETIAVIAAGDEIKRGIYRDFPTLYHVPLWGGGPEIPADLGGGPLLSYRMEVPFSVRAVERDGHFEPYHLATTANGVRVYAGSEDVMLPPGPHVYRFTYTTSHQLGFFPDHDELYWNVTGNGWSFPIERATATVILPAGIPRDRVTVEGYTGAQGSTARHLTAGVDPSSGELRFATTRPLNRNEGLTIVASFPKGFIAAPSAEQERRELLRANPIFLFAPLGIAVVVLYYAIAWLKVGRDPSRGTIIPLFEPPLGLDAAGVRYVAGMGYDERCFTAALVGLGVKGWARIEEADGGEVTVHPSKARDEALGPGEQKVQKALLAGGACELKQANHKRIAAAISGLREALQREYEGTMFRANKKWAVPGIVLSALVVLAAGFSGRFEQSIGFGFMLVWLTGWTFACFHLGTNVWRTWREVFRPDSGLVSRGGNLVLALIMTAFALPFFAGEVFGLGMLVAASSLWMGFFIVALVALNFLFYHLLKQPTLAGRKLMDQIDGFKMYLTTAEGDELAHAVPEKTPKLYERLLPYAIALGVENQWAAQFADVLRRAAIAEGDDGYRPRWYNGSLNRVGAQSFASSLTSSLGTRVSSSSTAPGSRSGGSGGGSSGGGGGGGGGGGW